MNGFLGEFLGTMILIVFGVGCGAGISLNKAYAKGQGSLVAMAWGWPTGVYVAGQFGSQGHLNPAVTIGFALWLFPLESGIAVLIRPILGAFVSSLSDPALLSALQSH